MITRAAERGFLLVAAVALIALGALMAIALATLTAGGSRSGAEQLASTQAFYAAEAGFERALYGYSKQGVACAGLVYSGAVGNASYSTTGALYNTSSALPSAMDATQTYVPIAVASLASYADFGQVSIGAERINYARKSTSAADCGGASSCLAGAQRGAEGTTPATHVAGAAVTQNQCLLASVGSVAETGATRTARAAVLSSGGTSAIAFDASSQGNTVNVTTSLSWQHTVGNVANRILIVGVAIRTPTSTVSSITYGGQSLVFAGAQTRANNARTEIWYLINPNIGTHTITVTTSSGTEMVGGAVSLSGADQAQDLSTQFAGNSDNSSTPNVQITTPVDNAWVVDALAYQRGGGGGGVANATAGAGQTTRWNQSTGSGNADVGGAGSTQGPLVPAGTVTMSWSLTRGNGTSISRPWALGIVYVRPGGAHVVYWREHFP